MIAALFVETDGVYYGRPGVDPWDESRDARLYKGPHPVVCHSPCARWGRYWHGGPSAKERQRLGDDGGCFAAALRAVRTFGGVLEHPEGSHAFRAFGLGTPRWREGWRLSDDQVGHICCVAQGHYGHRARKLTWLYAVRTRLPKLDFSIPRPRARLDYGFHSAAERRRRRATVAPRVNAARLSAVENLRTPEWFRDVLIAMARSARGVS